MGARMTGKKIVVKTLSVDVETWERVQKLRIEKRFKTVNQTIRYLLEVYDKCRESVEAGGGQAPRPQ
ncbi:MAG: hypothetical protein ABWK00_01410 [Desulfurococcaceae archaeon]